MTQLRRVYYLKTPGILELDLLPITCTFISCSVPTVGFTGVSLIVGMFIPLQTVLLATKLQTLNKICIYFGGPEKYRFVVGR